MKDSRGWRGGVWVAVAVVVTLAVAGSTLAEETVCGDATCTVESDCGESVGAGCHCHGGKCSCQACAGDGTIVNETYRTVIRYQEETVESFKSIEEQSKEAVAHYLSKPFHHDDDHDHGDDDDHDDHDHDDHDDHDHKISVRSRITERAEDGEEDIIHGEDITVVSVVAGSAIVTYEFVLTSVTSEQAIASLDAAVTSGEFATTMNMSTSNVVLEQGTSLQDTVVDETNECNTSCRNWKIAFLFIILFEAVIFGLIPRLFPKVRSTPRGALIIDLIDVYSGGILFSTALVHLLPHGFEILYNYEITQWQEFPYTCTMFGLGFIMVLGVEALLAPWLFSVITKQDLHGDEEGVGDDGHHCGTVPMVQGPTEAETAAAKEEAIDAEMGDTVEDSDSSRQAEEQARERKNGMNLVRATIGAAVTTIALSMHSIFAGLALGLGEWSQALALFIAIIAHKWSAALAIGIQLVEGGIGLWVQALWVTGFALVTPIGIAIGLGVSSANINKIAEGTVQTLAAGMLAFVGSVGSIGVGGVTKARASWGTKWLMFLAYVCGYATMVIISAIITFTGVHEAAH